MHPDLPAGVPAVEDRIVIAGHALAIIRPRSADELISEEEYADDERLPYWAELWPSGLALAEAVAALDVTGLRVVELGAGLGLPALVAAGRGARVVATDWYAPALAFVRHNAACLGLDVETMLVDWRTPPAALLDRAPFDLVLAADVAYEARNVAPLHALLGRLAGSRGRAVLADPRRPDARTLLDGLAADGWTVRDEDVPVRGRVDEAGPVVRLSWLDPPPGTP